MKIMKRYVICVSWSQRGRAYYSTSAESKELAMRTAKVKYPNAKYLEFVCELSGEI